MDIEVTFLGTSQAIPTKTRNHTSILLTYKDENILIDCGEGTQRQFRKASLNPCKITKLLITHWHGDHVLGLPGLFQTLALNGYHKKLEVYGPKGTRRYMKQLISDFIPVLKFEAEVHEVTGKFFENNDFILQSFPLKHKKVPTNGYAFIEKDKLRIDKNKLKKLKIDYQDLPRLSELTKGKSIKIKNRIIKPEQLTYKQKGKKISFIFDTKTCDSAKKLAKDSDLAIIESTYSDEESALASAYGHMTASQAGKIAKQSNVKKLVLTHISQRYEYNEKILLEQAKENFGNTEIAKDFLKIGV